MSEVHISSLVVMCAPEKVDAVTDFSVQEGGLDWHVDPLHPGKAIAVFEGGSLKQTDHVIQQIQALPGVISVSLIYHHAEDDAAVNEEIE